MPIIKSAKKRVKTAEKAAIRNSKTKRSLKTAFKAFHKAVAAGEDSAIKLHGDVQSNIDKATKKGLMHKNKAARQKAQLAKAMKAAADNKPVAAKKTTTTKKPTTAKATPAKAAAKKPVAAKKAPATKKPAAKKATPKK